MGHSEIVAGINRWRQRIMDQLVPVVPHSPLGPGVMMGMHMEFCEQVFAPDRAGM